MKRDLFTDTPSDDAPAADVQDRQRGTERTLDREAQQRIAPPGAAAEQQTCGTCAESSEWVIGNSHRTGFVNCAQLPSWRHLNPSTTCTFEKSRWRAIDARALIKRNAQAGIDQAVGAADAAAPGWSDRALAWIRTFSAAHQGERLAGYTLVQRSIAAGAEQPENGPKAWGGPIQRAARAGYLVKVGTVADPNPERHGSDVPLWECACADTP